MTGIWQLDLGLIVTAIALLTWIASQLAGSEQPPTTEITHYGRQGHDLVITRMTISPHDLPD
ncbi:MAG TPA: hypothetical protein VM223_05515 [Planctomycetota bacterium]|nr:hypothetical protein [Planctomycetota bacterium]